MPQGESGRLSFRVAREEQALTSEQAAAAQRDRMEMVAMATTAAVAAAMEDLAAITMHPELVVAPAAFITEFPAAEQVCKKHCGRKQVTEPLPARAAAVEEVTTAGMADEGSRVPAALPAAAVGMGAVEVLQELVEEERAVWALAPPASSSSRMVRKA